jgi:hypothetical protein
MDTTTIRQWYPLPLAGDTDPATCAAAMIHRLCDEVDRLDAQWGVPTGPVTVTVRPHNGETFEDVIFFPAKEPELPLQLQLRLPTA